MQNLRVSSYNPLDIKQTVQRTKTLNSILGVWSFANNISKFHAENQRFLPPRFWIKFSCGASCLPSGKSRDITCKQYKQYTSCARGENSFSGRGRNVDGGF